MEAQGLESADDYGGSDGRQSANRGPQAQGRRPVRPPRTITQVGPARRDRKPLPRDRGGRVRRTSGDRVLHDGPALDHHRVQLLLRIFEQCECGCGHRPPARPRQRFDRVRAIGIRDLVEPAIDVVDRRCARVPGVGYPDGADHRVDVRQGLAARAVQHGRTAVARNRLVPALPPGAGHPRTHLQLRSCR